MHIQARRIFRLSGVMALTLALAYALKLPMPFIAPLFALIFTAAPAPPMGLKSLLGLLLVVLITLGIGLLLIPLLLHQPVTALLVVAGGLYFCFFLSVNLGKGLVGSLLTVGFTMISAAGTLDFTLAITVIQALVFGITLAVLCQWLVYPWFPEDPAPTAKAPAEKSTPEQSNWIALRGVLIVFPVYFLALTNPAGYMAIIMKAVALAKQSSHIDARSAGRELLGSTFLGGCFAIGFWMLLGIFTNLWMFFLWMLFFGVYFSSKIYQLIPSRFPASFWLNVVMTLFILLGPAVEDSASGKDVYAAFSVRFGLFVAVTLYAWVAVYLLEYLRERRLQKRILSKHATEPSSC